MKKQEYIYRVSFGQPPFEDSDKTEFFFTSLAAIYEQFTQEQIGCSVTNLWNKRVEEGRPYENRRHTCKIIKEPLHRKRHAEPLQE